MWLRGDSGGTINLKEMDRGIKEAVREKYGKDSLRERDDKGHSGGTQSRDYRDIKRHL